MKFRTSVASLTALLIFSTTSAFACMGGSLTVNDDITLYGDSIKSAQGQKPADTIDYVGHYFNLKDSKNIETHKVLILGVIADKGGVVATNYLLKDLNTSTEKIVKVSTNYMGNGVRARGNGSDDKMVQDKNFKSLQTIGCSSN